MVRDFYDSTYRPLRLIGASPRTDDAYRDTVSAWDRWPGHCGIPEIDDLVFARWLAWLAERSSASTANKHRRHMLCLLRLAVKRRVMAAVPDVPPLRAPLKLPQAWSVDEVEAIIVVAQSLAGTIAGVPAGRWWRSLLLAIYDTGSRIGAMLSLEPANLSLPGRSLVLLGTTTKARRPQYCHLSDQTVAAIAAIYDPDRDRVWPWPFIRMTLYRWMRRILTAAGVPHGKDNGGLFHRLRKTSGTLVAANGGNAQLHLGHASATTTNRFYVDPRIAAGGQLQFLPRPGTAEKPQCLAWNLD